LGYIPSPLGRKLAESQLDYKGAVNTPLLAAGYLSHPLAREDRIELCAIETFAISACFAALSALMLGLIISRTAVPMAMLLVIVAVTGYTDLARLSTPDAMACFFSLVGIHSLMAQGRVVFLVAAILPLIRTDFILLSSMLMGYAYVQEQRLFALWFMLIAAGIYFLVKKLNGSYGYLTLFNFSLIGSLTPTPRIS
jgi:hypothetical protein